MIKKSSILLSLLFPAALVFGQVPDCGKFREGKFRIADSRAGVVTIADRRGAYQTESSEALKAIVLFRISWQDNCNYTLRLDKVLRNENKIDFPSNLEIKVAIIETTEAGYTQRITSPLANGSYNVVVTKIN